MFWDSFVAQQSMFYAIWVLAEHKCNFDWYLMRFIWSLIRFHPLRLTWHIIYVANLCPSMRSSESQRTNIKFHLINYWPCLTPNLMHITYIRSIILSAHATWCSNLINYQPNWFFVLHAVYFCSDIKWFAFRYIIGFPAKYIFCVIC